MCPAPEPVGRRQEPRVGGAGHAGSARERRRDRHTGQVLIVPAQLDPVSHLIHPEHVDDMAPIKLLIAFDVDQAVRVQVRAALVIEEERPECAVAVAEIVGDLRHPVISHRPA